MPFTREQLLAEAQRRGLQIPQASQPTQAPQFTREQLLAEAQRRGLQIPQAQPTQPEQPSTLEATGRGIVQGGTLGFGEELKAGIGAALDYLSGQGGDIAKNYETLRNAYRGEEQAAQQAHPEAYLGGQLLGGVATGGIAGVGKSLAGTAIRGAGVGAASGLGAAEGSLEDQAKQATKGALFGAALPIALPTVRAGAAAVGKKLLRGKTTTEQAAQNLENFVRSGVDATPGQITNAKWRKGVETLLAKAPLGGGKIRSQAEKVQQQFGTRVNDIANRLSAGEKSASAAGETLTKAVDDFEQAYKEIGRAKYDKLYDYVPPDKAVSVQNTLDALKKVTTLTPGAEKTTAGLISNKLTAVANNIAEDAANGTLPFKGLQELRTLMGQSYNSKALKGIQKSKIDQIYGAMSEDIKQAASAQGQSAKRAFEDANSYWRHGVNKLEKLQKLTKAEYPEKAFAQVMAGAKDGPSKLLRARQGLNKDQWNHVVATHLKKMGEATPGRAGAEETFSSRTFLTNWNRIDNAAKNVMFGAKSDLRKNIDSLAKVAGRIDEQAQELANPSGTAGALLQYALASGAAGAAITSNPGAAASLAAGLLATKAAASLITNPKTARWLASSTNIRNPGAYTQWVTRGIHLGAFNADQAD